MSVNIKIDRLKTLEALLRQYNLIPLFRFAFGEPADTDVVYRDGWFFVNLRISGKYPAVTHGKVHAMLPAYGTDGSAMLVYIHDLTNYFFHFFEVEKGQTSTYMGTLVDADGRLRYFNIPNNRNVTLLPAGTIKPQDTLLSGLYIINDGGTQRVRIIVKRIDFSTRTFVDLVDYTDTISYNFHVVSAYGPEPRGVACRFGIAFAVTGPIQYFYDIAPWLVKYGLPDPRLVHPWR